MKMQNLAELFAKVEILMEAPTIADAESLGDIAEFCMDAARSLIRVNKEAYVECTKHLWEIPFYHMAYVAEPPEDPWNTYSVSVEQLRYLCHNYPHLLE